MATATAAPPSTAAPTDPTRHLWQVPVLLLGAAAFVSAWQGVGPLAPDDPVRTFVQDLSALRACYEKNAPDPLELKNLLNKVAAGVESYPNQGPTARFHLGSGYVRLAEITPALDESRGYWTLARQHFEMVTDKQLRDPLDAPKLAFRSAKARAAVGLLPDTPGAELLLLATVLSAPPPGEDGGETHRLIADLALRANPPDVPRAKVELTRYLESTGIATPAASLARARFRLGDLYLRTQEYELARKWLEQIGTEAPDVLPPAKAALSQVLMATANFPAAVKEWESLRGMPGVSQALRQMATYQLAQCKLKLRETEAAARLLEDSVKGDGAEAPAAAIQLADLYLRGPDPARHKAAVDLLAGAFKGVRNSSEYDPALVTLNEAQAAFELAVTVLMTDGAYESALKAAEVYTAIAAPGRDREKRAEVLGAWGNALQKARGDARPKFRAAADEFVALAAFQPKTDGKVDMLRRAASFYRQAGEPAAAALRLEEAAQLPEIPEAVELPLWVELADAKLASGQPNGVFEIFNKVMAKRDHPLSTETRYRLARQFVDTRHAGLVPLGRALFEQITKQQTVSAAEREFHEKAFGDLAHILIHEGNFAEAEAKARAQLGRYPNGPWAGHARLLLGVALLQRAATLPPAQAADAAKMRTEALASFKQIVADCDAIERRTGKLPEREGWLRLQASVRVLQAYQQMRTQQSARELLFEGGTLRDRYKGTVEELIILSLMYHAFKQMNDTGNALTTREQMKEVFDALPAAAFTQQTGEYSREYWLKWWFTEPKK
jgi:tetratricopeptide (TPR) repeat protein